MELLWYENLFGVLAILYCASWLPCIPVLAACMVSSIIIQEEEKRDGMGKTCDKASGE